MKNLFLLVSSVLLLLSISVNGQNASSGLTGKWQLSAYKVVKSDNSEKANTIISNLQSLITKGASYTFQDDHTVIKSNNAASTYTYTVNGSEIVISHLSNGAISEASKEVFNFKFDHDQLIFTFNPSAGISIELLLKNTK